MSRFYRVEQDTYDKDLVALVSSVLSSGGIVVLPTETVYGLAISPAACQDAEQIFVLKRRSHDFAIPWILDNPDALQDYADEITPEAERLAKKFWPGPLTLVVPASKRVPEPFRASDGTIALRVPSLPFVRQVAVACGGALCVTSANTHGLPAASSCEELEPRILDKVSLVVDGGQTSFGNASTIVSCVGPTPVIIRESALSAEQIEGALHA